MMCTGYFMYIGSTVKSGVGGKGFQGEPEFINAVGIIICF